VVCVRRRDLDLPLITPDAAMTEFGQLKAIW
jgi:hypothetical protein